MTYFEGNVEDNERSENFHGTNLFETSMRKQVRIYSTSNRWIRIEFC